MSFEEDLFTFLEHEQKSTVTRELSNTVMHVDEKESLINAVNMPNFDFNCASNSAAITDCVNKRASSWDNPPSSAFITACATEKGSIDNSSITVFSTRRLRKIRRRKSRKTFTRFPKYLTRTERVLWRMGFRPITIVIPRRDARIFTYSTQKLQEMVNKVQAKPPQLRMPKVKKIRGNWLSKYDSDTEIEEYTDADMGKDNIYEVEKILSHVCDGRGTFYLIKWLGWKYRTSTWERNVGEDCKEAIKEYNIRYSVNEAILRFAESSDVKFIYLRLTRPDFYFAHKCEDRWNQMLAKGGIARLYIENWTRQRFDIPDFTFVTKNLFSEEALAYFNSPNEVNGCQCAEDCSNPRECCPRKFSAIKPYVDNMLRRAFVQKNKLKAMVVECTPKCKCNPTICPRFVQNGRKIPVVIFKTVAKGWSVRTAEAIQKNTFVMEYIGKVYTYDDAPDDTTYQFLLDSCMQPKFILDAKEYGNEARFVNHSCEPNMSVQLVECDRLHSDYYRIAYFSNRFIKKGEELTIFYFSNYTDDAYKKRVMENKVNRVRCRCGSKNCRKYLL